MAPNPIRDMIINQNTGKVMLATEEDKENYNKCGMLTAEAIMLELGVAKFILSAEYNNRYVSIMIKQLQQALELRLEANRLRDELDKDFNTRAKMDELDTNMSNEREN